jgi:O-antigen/teichoic acid export membrane protein
MTRVRSNALAMVGTFLIQGGFVFLQVKLLTHWLTPAEFGLYSSIFALGALLGSLAELGFSVVLVRYGAKFDAENRLGALRRLLHVAIGLWAVTGLLLGGLLFLLAGPVAEALRRPEVTAGLLVLGFFSVLSFSFRSFSSAAFQGERRMSPALLIELVYMAGVTATYVVLGDRLSVVSVFWTFLGWGVVVGLGGLLAFDLMAARDRSFDTGTVAVRGLLSEIRSFWGGALVTTALAIAFENADRIVLAALLPFEAVAVYHLAGRINLFTRKILFIPQQVTKPELAFKWERGAVEPLRQDLLLFSKLEWAVGVLLGVLVVIGARPGILLASDARYLSAEPVLVAMAGALPILSLAAPLTTFLRASGRIWISVRSDTIWLLSSLALGILFLRFWGVPGFAMGQMFAAMLALLYTVWSLRRNGYPCPSLRFLFAHGAGAVLLWGAAVGITRWKPVTSLPAAILAGSVFVVLLNAALARFHYLTPAEESRLFALLGSGPLSRIGRLLLAWPRVGSQGAHGQV